VAPRDWSRSGSFCSRDDEIQVQQGGYRDFNDWTLVAPFGTLVDQGSDLVVVDPEGNEIVPEI
jgi:hypothetical protein